MTTAIKKASVGPAYFWGILLGCAFALIALAWLKASGHGPTYEDQRGALRSSKLQALRKEESNTLSNYAWANKEKGIARIPIERAMELVAADLKNGKPAPSTVKVENPYPAGLAPQAPAPAAGAEAAPATAPAQSSAPAAPATQAPASGAAPAAATPASEANK